MRQSKSLTAVSIASNLGFGARVFDKDDVIHLLAAAIESEGGQTAFAKHHGINRTYLNMIFNRKRPVSDSIAGAAGFARFISPKSWRRARRGGLRPTTPS
jgi:hypothetical protein